MKFKNKTVEERWDLIHQKLQEIIKDADEFMKRSFNRELVITETATTAEEDKKVGRVHATHRDRPGRAVDIRNRDWSKNEKLAFCTYLTEIYGHLGAVSSGSKQVTLIYDKNHGTGPHFHVQIRRGLK